MDRARIYHLITKMKKDELQAHALRLHEAADALRQVVDSIPQEEMENFKLAVDRLKIDRVIDL